MVFSTFPQLSFYVWQLSKLVFLRIQHLAEQQYNLGFFFGHTWTNHCQCQSTSLSNLCCYFQKANLLVLGYLSQLVLRDFIMLWVKTDSSYILCFPNTELKENPYCMISISFLTASCCYADFTEQLAHSPVIKVNNSYWNRCGQLSKS